MTKEMLSVPLAILLALGLALSTGSRAATAAGGQNVQKFEVKIDNFTFAPAAITLPVGATVTWVNKDDIPHTVVSTDGKGIKSSVLDTDEKFSFTFTKKGSYAYFCSIHPRMTGKVIVR